MSLNLSKIKSSSLLPGLQNVGTAIATFTINGVIPPQGNLVGSGRLSFPKEAMALIRVNLPNAHGDLAAYWFPVVGSVQLYDATDKWYLTLYSQPDANGRNISFDFTSNDAAASTTLTNFPISLYAHLFTYPF